MIIIFIFVASVFNYFIITTIVDVILMGRLDFRFDKCNRQSQYRILKNNKIDIQTGFKCSAYSCAYVLRHFEIQTDVENLYNEMPNKMKNGYVYPKGILKILSEYGLSVKYRRGNLNALKNDLNEGNPIIIMIRTGIGENYLHYVPVVGYDEQYIFIAESIREYDNCFEPYYNRRIDNKNFLKLWNTSMLKMPFYRNTYFVIEKR